MKIEITSVVVTNDHMTKSALSIGNRVSFTLHNSGVIYVAKVDSFIEKDIVRVKSGDTFTRVPIGGISQIH